MLAIATPVFQVWASPVSSANAGAVSVVGVASVVALALGEYWLSPTELVARNWKRYVRAASSPVNTWVKLVTLLRLTQAPSGDVMRCRQS